MASQQPTSASSPTAPHSPLPEMPAQPVDTELLASQAQADRRAAQRSAGVPDVPPPVASPTSAPVSTPPRTMADIQSEMDATRVRLTNTLNDLQEAVQPKNIVKRQTEKIRDYYVDEFGAVRPERVVKTAAIVVGTVIAVRVTKRVLITIF